MGILEVKGLNKRFGGLQALDNVNLSVAENALHAIIGPNGAGKSTLLNVLVGKLTPDSGSVTFDGHSVLGRSGCPRRYGWPVRSLSAALTGIVTAPRGR